LSKGTIFFYFRTKQELFLAYTREEVDAWHKALDSRLELLIASGEEITIDAFLDVIDEFIRDKKSVFRLIAILGSIIEVNIDEETLYAFKIFLRNRMTRTGTLLEQLLDIFEPGDGVRFYQYSFFIFTGIYPMAKPVPRVKKILQKQELQMYTIDFEKTLLEMLRLLLRGWKAG
jgi:AcrR family transcriptional regulator